MKRSPATLAIALVAACGSPRRSEALGGSYAFADADLARGRVVYAQRCHACHPGGEAGLGPSLNEKPLPEFLIRYQVRHGLGAMPAFGEGEVSGSDLDRVVAYMKARRGNR